MRPPTDALIKLLLARDALKPLMLTMNPHMLRQIFLPREPLRANFTRKQFLFAMNNAVPLQIAFRIKLLAANTGDVFVSMEQFVMSHILSSIGKYIFTL